jgi:Tfp pilus assembly protein PilN
MVALGMASMGLAGGMGSWYASVRRAEAHLAAQIAILDRELALLKRALAPAEATRGLLADLTRRTRALEELGRGQVPLGRALEALPEAVPREVWLTSLEARGLALRAAGSAASARAVADFAANLRDTGFVGVEIALSRRDLAADPPGPVSFAITCRLHP